MHCPKQPRGKAFRAGRATASRPLTVGFVLRTLVLAAVGAVPATVFMLLLMANLPF